MKELTVKEIVDLYLKNGFDFEKCEEREFEEDTDPMSESNQAKSGKYEFEKTTNMEER